MVVSVGAATAEEDSYTYKGTEAASAVHLQTARRQERAGQPLGLGPSAVGRRGRKSQQGDGGASLLEAGVGNGGHGGCTQQGVRLPGRGLADLDHYDPQNARCWSCPAPTAGLITSQKLTSNGARA
jgi:hypothetical protein